MTPQEKAKELVETYKFYAYANTNFDNEKFTSQLLDNAKKCALLALEFAKNNYAIEDDYEEIESIKQEITKL